MKRSLMMKAVPICSLVVAVFVGACGLPTAQAQMVIRVPADAPTIQEAIDMALAGDTCPGGAGHLRGEHQFLGPEET